MSIACYADDPKEPELIGEGTVDLTEVFTKGETDGVLYSQLTKDTSPIFFWQNGSPS
jgi:hypothetical protein